MHYIKYIIPIFVTILLVVFSYFTLNMTKYEPIYLKKSNYTIKLNNIKGNKPAVFRTNGESKFFIHPGEKKPTKGSFTFNENIFLKLHLSLEKGAKTGNIQFTIRKNNHLYTTVQIDSKRNLEKKVYIYLSKGDTLEILADKNGDTIYDWGSLFIEKITFSNLLKNILIPILWIFLLLFLWYYNFIIIGILSYSLFLLTVYAELLNFGLLDIPLLSSYTLLYFSLSFIFILTTQLLNKFKISIFTNVIITTMVLIVPLINIIYISIFDTKITQSILFAIFQTNPNESIEFMKSFVDLKYFIFLFIIIVFLFILFYLQNRNTTHSLEKKLVLFLLIVFSSLSWIHFKELNLLNMVQNSYEQYIKEVTLFNQEKEKRKVSNLIFNATKKNQHETYIVMIGESLNKYHMSLYGYPRKTTPQLDKMRDENNLTTFHETYSNHTVTTYSLSLALTQANQYNQQKYYSAISIIEILNKANFETYWVTAQPTHGAFQNLITVIATEADYFIPIDMYDAQKGLDGSLIQKVKKILKTPQDKNRVIFVHLMGSHYTYAKRYPKEQYSLFKGPLSLHGKVYKNEKINTYDNSVAYNDYVVSSILKSLQEKDGINGFIYMSDHAEDVLEDKAHNPTQFTFAMTQIPMISWFSSKYKVSYPKIYQTLISNTHQLFSNDLLYDTLIGLMNIKTDKYKAKYDLSSKEYSLEDEDALVLHGTKKYIDKNNIFYWKEK